MDPVMGWQISPKVAAALCLKPTLADPTSVIQGQGLQTSLADFVTERILLDEQKALALMSFV